MSLLVFDAQNPCSDCKQHDVGQTGEYPCPTCKLPVTWDESQINLYSQMRAEQEAS